MTSIRYDVSCSRSRLSLRPSCSPSTRGRLRRLTAAAMGNSCCDGVNEAETEFVKESPGGCNHRTGHSSELPRLLQSSAASGEVGTPAAFPEAMFPEFTLEISRLLPVQEFADYRATCKKHSETQAFQKMRRIHQRLTKMKRCDLLAKALRNSLSAEKLAELAEQNGWATTSNLGPRKRAMTCEWGGWFTMPSSWAVCSWDLCSRLTDGEHCC